MQEYSNPHPLGAQYNVNISSMVGGTVGIGNNVHQVVTMTQAEVSELATIMQGIRGFLPHMKLDSTDQGKLGMELERVDKEMARKSPDRGRIVASLGTIRDILKIAGETTITAAVNAFLTKIGFPGAGH